MRQTLPFLQRNLTFYGSEVLHKFFTDGLEFTVTGGTGRYTGTRGTVTITATEAAGEGGALIAFDLTRR